MKAILALGNPGERYRDTRHNAGWWLADRLRATWSFPPFRPDGDAVRSEGIRKRIPVRILKPLTYVNRSGRVVEGLLRQPGFQPASHIMVLVDDVSLPPGAFRIRARGSSGGHNGLASVEAALGSREYGRLRIGVGRPDDTRVDLADWVLASPPGHEEEVIVEAFCRQVRAVECWMEEGVEAAMNRFNR